ncbi:MAG: lipocalin-like domain-containing protein [bacterium]|nr:lipocalin-like domain-containing protein [bacterium]
MVAEQFIGTWLLVSQDSHYPDGRVVPSRGEQPAGILIYDGAGNMAVQLMRTDERAGDYRDVSELRTAMEGYHAYFGTYEVDEAAGVVRHHVIGSAFPPYRGSVQVRAYRFDGDTLTLTAQAPHDETRRVLIWRRAH